MLLMQTTLCKAFTKVQALLLLWVLIGPQAEQHHMEGPGYTPVRQPRMATSVITSETVEAADRLRMAATVGLAVSV